MLNIKRNTISFWVLSSTLYMATGLSYAQPSMPPICSTSAWEVGVAALYLKPSFGGNGLGYSSFSSYAGADNQQVIRSLNGPNHITNITPKWNFGFKLDAGYRCGLGNDININWSHLNQNVDGHLPHGSLFSGSVDGFYAGSLQLDTKWDALNIEMGKQFHFCDSKWVRLHAGVALARIKTTFTNSPTLFLNDTVPYLVSNDDISYKGFGPRLGADLGYGVYEGVKLYAKTAGSVLIGTAKQSISGYRDVNNAIYGLIPFGTDNFTQSNSNVIVPALEAKLGITYDCVLAQGNLGMDLGYMWMNYLQALTTYTGIGVVFPSVGLPGTSNFNLNGLYFGLKWTGDF